MGNDTLSLILAFSTLAAFTFTLLRQEPVSQIFHCISVMVRNAPIAADTFKYDA